MSENKNSLIVKKISAQCFEISKHPGLDPVQIFLTDDGYGHGALTVACYGNAWTCWWGGMGMPIKDFISMANNSYIANCLIRGQRHLMTKQSTLNQSERHIQKIVEAIKFSVPNWDGAGS